MSNARRKRNVFRDFEKNRLGKYAVLRKSTCVSWKNETGWNICRGFVASIYFVGLNIHRTTCLLNSILLKLKSVSCFVFFRFFSFLTCCWSTWLVSPYSNIVFCLVFNQVYLRAVGGEIGATSSLAPKIGPLGLVSWNILNDIFLLLVIVVLWYSLPRKLVKISPRVPRTGKAWRLLSSWPSRIVKLQSLLCHQLPPWLSRLWRSLLVTARSRRTVSRGTISLEQSNSNKSYFLVKHNGNITFDEVISIARIMRTRSQSRFLLGTVKEILGTCMVNINKKSVVVIAVILFVF